jgi:NitT/TauT family transport system ATP-binding protein
LSAIRYDNVSLVYESNGHQALKDFELDILPGEIVSLIGPSGCGKSTTLNLAAGLLAPTYGELKIGDKIVKEPGLDRGVVFQNYSLFPWMSVLENVRFALEQKEKLPNQKLKEKAITILEKVGIERKVMSVFPSQISGGMQQRVALARMFALDAPVFLMDEPFGAVDEITRTHLQDLLLQLWDDALPKKTVLLVTHNIDEAIYLSDRVIVINEGKKVLDQSIPFTRSRDRFEIETERSYTDIRQQLVYAIADKNWREPA